MEGGREMSDLRNIGHKDLLRSQREAEATEPAMEVAPPTKEDLQKATGYGDDLSETIQDADEYFEDGTGLPGSSCGSL